MTTRTTSLALASAIACVLAVGCVQSERNAGAEGDVTGAFGGSRVTVPTGAPIDVRLDESLSSESARSGDSWHGVVNSALVVDGKEAIPAGAEVQGVVVSAEGARRGSRARLELALRAVQVGDRSTALRASAEPVIAGSTRARNLGAIAGGAAAGALIGEATDGKARKGAIIGGVLATGAVAASKGYQVVLKNGTVMTFTVSNEVSIRVG